MSIIRTPYIAVDSRHWNFKVSTNNFSVVLYKRMRFLWQKFEFFFFKFAGLVKWLNCLLTSNMQNSSEEYKKKHKAKLKIIFFLLFYWVPFHSNRNDVVFIQLTSAKCDKYIFMLWCTYKRIFFFFVSFPLFLSLFISINFFLSLFKMQFSINESQTQWPFLIEDFLNFFLFFFHFIFLHEMEIE